MLPDKNTRAWFPETRWTQILALRDNADNEVGRAALATLCKAYWRPLYSHARRLGHEPPEAEDYTQSFLLTALEKNLLGKAEKTRGKMRTYLLGLFKNHIHNDFRRSSTIKRGGSVRFISMDDLAATEKYLSSQKSDLRPPDSLYDYEYALTLVDEAFTKLERDEVDAGRGNIFEELRHLIDHSENEDESQRVLAERLGITHGALRQTVWRLRQRLRDCLRSAVRETLENPSESEVDEELMFLKSVLGQGRTQGQ